MFIPEIKTDSAGNQFVDVDNVRLTYVKANTRSPDANWSGHDVIRIQAYRGGENNALHSGAEFPIESPTSIHHLIISLLTLIEL